MKKYLFGLFAIALAIGFSAFTKPVTEKAKPAKFADVYYIYVSGDQSVATNYTTQSTKPANCNFSTNLCWLKVPNGSTFAATFTALDVNSSGTITSADGAEDHSAVELKQ